MTVVHRTLLSFILLAGVVTMSEGSLRLAGFVPPQRLFERVAGTEGEDSFQSIPWRFEAERLMGQPLVARSFDAVPKAGEFRIFVIGESTAYGYPIGPAASFAHRLGLGLSLSAPAGKSATVINAAAPGINSEDVLEILQEVLGYRADLIIISSGHNEFINHPWAGRSVLGDDIQIALRHTALYGFTRRVMRGKLDSEGDDLKRFLTVLFPLQRMPLAPSDQQRSHIHSFFRSRLGAMQAAARSHAVPVVFITQASNMRDWKPYAGQDAIEYFGAARILEERGMSGDEVRRYYRLARDLDGHPVRAVSEINSAIREAASGEGAYLIDLEAEVNSWGRGGIPGTDLFMDDVHPRPEIQSRIGRFLHSELWKAGLVPWSPAMEDAGPPQLEHAIYTKAYLDEGVYCAYFGEDRLAADHLRRATELAASGKDHERDVLLKIRLGLAVVLHRLGDAAGSRSAIYEASLINSAAAKEVDIRLGMEKIPDTANPS